MGFLGVVVLRSMGEAARSLGRVDSRSDRALQLLPVGEGSDGEFECSGEVGVVFVLLLPLSCAGPPPPPLRC